MMRSQRSTDTIAVLASAIAVLFALFVCGAGTAYAQKPAPATALDDILKQVATYDGGIESEPLWKLRDYVIAHRDDPAGRAECETKLLAFLKTTATPSAKMAAAKHLRALAGDNSVPALQALIADERSVDMALYVLRQIPGPAVDKALMQALGLPRLPASTKIALIADLGDRAVAEAVPMLVPLMQQPEFARAAATSLGAIGNDQAAQALVAAYPAAANELKVPVAASVLKCAERALAAKNQAAALKLYEVLWADAALPVPMRKAAAAGRLSSAGSEAPTMLIAYLQGADAEMQEVAIAKITEVVKLDAVAPVCALLPRLPVASQVKLVTALANYPTATVLPTVLTAARADSADVRLAAFKTLERVGDASVVPLLAQAAAGSRGAEQTAARSALGLLKGRAVDAEILSLLGNKPADDVEGELILAVAERRMFPAKNLVAAALSSSSAKVRVQAMKALRTLGSYSDIPAVLDLLVKATDEGERAEAEGSAAALAMKWTNPDGRAGAVTQRLKAEKDADVRARLIALLPLIGDPSTLPVLRSSLADPDADIFDAAARALCAWPTPAAREDVMRLARDSRSETHRLLAIAGLVRLIGLEKYRDRAAAVADLRQAAGFAWRAEEQRLVLGALPPFACQDALDLATSFLREPSVKTEAQAAVDKIKQRLEAAKKSTT
ncbi:MAG: HEAT repeat domain-containing protein [Bacteroidales bacterium]